MSMDSNATVGLAIATIVVTAVGVIVNAAIILFYFKADRRNTSILIGTVDTRTLELVDKLTDTARSSDWQDVFKKAGRLKQIADAYKAKTVTPSEEEEYVEMETKAYPLLALLESLCSRVESKIVNLELLNKEMGKVVLHYYDKCLKHFVEVQQINNETLQREGNWGGVFELANKIREIQSAEQSRMNKFA